MVRNWLVRLVRAISPLANFLRRLYSLTYLRIRGDAGYDRYEMKKHLQAMRRLVVGRGMTGGRLTDEGEFYLRTPEEIYLYYNIDDLNYTPGDGQSLDFQAATGRGPTAQALFALFKDGDTYFDVGANNGYHFSLPIAQAFPKTQVYAFEPNPMVLQHLTKNVAINRLDNVRIVKQALCERVGEAKLAFELGAGSFVVGHQATGLRTITVAANTLDQFVHAERLTAVDFIKVDIEGGEANFLRGATQTLARFKPVLIMELSDALLQRSQSSMGDVLDVLSAKSYQGYRIVGTRDAVFLPWNKLYQLEAVNNVLWETLGSAQN